MRGEVQTPPNPPVAWPLLPESLNELQRKKKLSSNSCKVPEADYHSF